MARAEPSRDRYWICTFQFICCTSDDNKGNAYFINYQWVHRQYRVHDMQNLMRYLCNCPIASTLQMPCYYNTNGLLLLDGVHLRLLLLRNRLSACWPNPLYLPVRFGSSSAVLFTFHMNLITPLIGLCAYTLTFCVDVAKSWSTPPSSSSSSALWNRVLSYKSYACK